MAEAQLRQQYYNTGVAARTDLLKATINAAGSVAGKLIG